jgi:CheY-like chemotaxis protein
MSEQKILIVDDEPSIRTLLRCALSAPGYSVFEADSGKAALMLAAQQGPFTLVVSDVLMPGIDGIELAEKLVGAGQARRFLFISGYCDGESMLERTRNLPVSAFLAKPFSIPDLVRAFRDLLEQDPASVRVAAVR